MNPLPAEFVDGDVMFSIAPLVAAAVVSLFLKGLSAYSKSRGNKKKDTEQNRADVASLNLRQKMTEDARIGRLQLGNSILNRVPSTTAGGSVNTNTGIDPAIFASLSQPRTYDFESTRTKPGTGAGWEFLSGLSGGAADVAARYKPSDDSSGSSSSKASPLADQAGGDPFAGASPAPVAPPLTIEDLMKLFKTTPGGQAEAGGLT